MEKIVDLPIKEHFPESLAPIEKQVKVEPFVGTDNFTPEIRELMLAQPLNPIKSVGFTTLSCKKHQ